MAIIKDAIHDMDIKISTLVEYLNALGLGIEVKVFPKEPKSGMPEELIILRS